MPFCVGGLGVDQPRAGSDARDDAREVRAVAEGVEVAQVGVAGVARQVGPSTTLPAAPRPSTGGDPGVDQRDVDARAIGGEPVGADRLADLVESGRGVGDLARRTGGVLVHEEVEAGDAIDSSSSPAGDEGAVHDDGADAAGAAHRTHGARRDPGDDAVDQAHAMGDLAAGGRDGARRALAHDDDGDAAVPRGGGRGD